MLFFWRLYKSSPIPVLDMSQWCTLKNKGELNVKLTSVQFKKIIRKVFFIFYTRLTDKFPKFKIRYESSPKNNFIRCFICGFSNTCINFINNWI
jgi:hypothetical protein